MNKTTNKGILVVVSGFSGAGKGTVMKHLLEKYGDQYALSVSVTTRMPREGEMDGVHYFFRTDAEFENMIQENAFVEYARYVEHSYGTPRFFVEENLQAGKNVLLEIELQGARKVIREYPDAVRIFITPPSIEVLKERLTGRGTETEDVIHARLKRASEEAKGMEEYDYILINDDLDQCVEELHHIITAEHHKAKRNLPFVSEIQAQAAKLAEGL